jgi:MFS family permease
MQRDLHASSLQIAATLSCYALGFGVTPLVTASLSEEFGRRPLYIITAFISFTMSIVMAL